MITRPALFFTLVLFAVQVLRGTVAFAVPWLASAKSKSNNNFRICSSPSTNNLHDDDDDASAGNDNVEEDEEEVPPGEMRVSEIKAELDLRQVTYGDCFDKDSLVERLHEARATGKASPEILETFNKQNLEQQLSEKSVELSEKDIEAAMANDGTLPGGLTPDQFKKMTESPELMNLLKSTKMQEAMSLMMTGGREELESKIKEDPELQKIVLELSKVVGGI